MSLVAFQDNIYYSFMFANHVWRSQGYLWLEPAAAGKLGQLSLNATKALSQANFGRSYHQSTIEVQGIGIYGQCLKSLAGELARVKPNSNLLIPILVLLTHSGSQSDLTGSVSHMRGLARLLHICGPTAFQEQPLLNAFEAARAIMVIGALIGKQRLFLDAEQWRTVPWQLNAPFKTPQSEFIDILVMIPGILHGHASLGPSSSMGDSSFRILLEKVQMQLVILYKWRWQWHIQYGHEVFEETVNRLSPSGTFRFTNQLHFSRFVLASELMLYNAILIWLLAVLYRIDSIGAVSHIEACAAAALPTDDTRKMNASFAPLRRLDATITLRDAALEICQTFEWVSRHHECSKESTFLYLFPVGMAMAVLQDDAVSMAWIRALLDVSPVTASYSQDSNKTRFGFYLNSEPLAPEKIQPQGTAQLFSHQDMQQLSM